MDAAETPSASQLRYQCLQVMLHLRRQGGSLTRLLPEAQQKLDLREHARLQAWCYGWCRWWHQLDALAMQLMDKPLKSRDLDVYLAIQLGLYQLRFTHVAPHAAVDQTVRLSKRLKKPWSRGLINAVLRQYQRRQDELESALSDEQRLSHPQWLTDRFRYDWPEAWERICQANNRQGPMTLRVNARRMSRDDYLQHLVDCDFIQSDRGQGGPIQGDPIQGDRIHGGPIHGDRIHGGPIQDDRIHGGRIHGGPIQDDRIHGGRIHGGRIHGGRIHGGRFHGDSSPAVALPQLPQALVLKKPVPVGQLPGFDEGLVSVQDAAAQLAAQWLVQHAPAGGRLLDACSAPGGKTAHALETGHFTSVVALDQDAERLERVQQTLERLQMYDEASLHSCDAADPDQWWDQRPFDAILLDAPCTGTGVVRRHPDIKLLRRESDVATLVAAQSRLLDALWPVLKPSGLMVYATCSVLKDENHRQIEAFLSRTPDACLIDAPMQILPGDDDMDGFFYALLRRQAQ